MVPARSGAALLLLVACGEPATSAAPLPAAPPQEGPVHVDGLPATVLAAPAGGWEARVAAGGALHLHGPALPAAGLALAEGVRAELAFTPGGTALAYAARAVGEDSDLYLQALPPTAAPQRLTRWPGAEDRPAFSPDGRQVAFVSGHSGIASIWVVPADGSGSPVQLTNVGLEHQARTPGQPPAGFVPPPEGDDLRWTAAGLKWTAEGRTWSVSPP